MEQQKKLIFSATTATGSLHIGHYLGPIKNWVNLQNEYDCLYCVADLHALTVRNNPATLRQNVNEIFLVYIATGLCPDKNIIYFQSHVPAHTQLAWVLNCYSYMGELSRMTQFKDKSLNHGENINAGLFTYPVLMAADILLFKTNLVPVGDDQKQHLELARDIAIRFNNVYGEVFNVPEPFIPKTGSRIMNLQEPLKKMSKSDVNHNGTIFILDEPNVIMNKIKRAVTDSYKEVRFDKLERPGVSNLLSIYSVITKKTIDECVLEFEGKGYGDFKKTIGEAIVEELAPIQKKYKVLVADTAYIKELAKNNAEKANKIAYKTLSKVHKKVGLPLF